MADGERIAKRMAAAGLCSRREAETWIAAGRVTVDGRRIDSPALNVTAENVVLVDGKPLAETGEPRVWLYHKPKGVMTTHKDPEGRPTVFSRLPKELPRVVSIGRLDYNSEGLLLLTTDGALARHLSHPSTGWVRRYRVRVHGTPTLETLAKLQKGVTVEDFRYGSIEVAVEAEKGGKTRANVWLDVRLREGKNRELRKVFEHFGHPVSRLIRIGYGPFQLGNLAEDAVAEAPRKMLRNTLGKPFF